MTNDIPTSSVDTVHHIQRQILVRLRQEGSLSYQQLKPDGMEGNAYNYHLRELKKSTLIVQEADQYLLTSTGHLVSDAFSYTTKRLMLRPYHYIAPLVTMDEYVLVYVPTRKPLTNYLCLPSGKLHYGDSTAEGISREMQRRNITSDYTVKELCPMNVRYLLNGAVVVHRPGTVWHVAYSGERRERQTESGCIKWLSWDDALRDERCLPELSMALAQLKTGSMQPIDLAYTL